MVILLLVWVLALCFVACNTVDGIIDATKDASSGESGSPADNPSSDPSGRPSTDPVVTMTASYQKAREEFKAVTGVELSDASAFDAQKKEAQFVVAYDPDVFAALFAGLKTELAKNPLSDNRNHWKDEGYGAFWEWDYDADGRDAQRKAKGFWFSTTRCAAGYDKYDRYQNASIDVNVSPLPEA